MYLLTSCLDSEVIYVYKSFVMNIHASSLRRENISFRKYISVYFCNYIFKKPALYLYNISLYNYIFKKPAL